MGLILDPKKTGSELRQNRIFQVEPDVDKSDIESVVEYLNSGGWLTEHKVTESLEIEVKNYVEREYAFSVPNGTIAIYLSLLASGIKKGSRVAIPNLTMIATINSVLWADATPVLIDVDESLCVSYEKLAEVNDLDAFSKIFIISIPSSIFAIFIVWPFIISIKYFSSFKRGRVDS